jgi:hypothetical protein
MNAEQQAIIIHESAKGTTTRNIEPIVGLDHTTINRAQAKLRDKIDAEVNEILNSGLVAARKTTIKLAEYGASEACVPGVSDVQWAKLSHDASKSILSIITSSQPSTIINALIQINQAPESTKEVQAITSFIDAQWETIEPEDSEGKTLHVGNTIHQPDTNDTGVGNTIQEDMVKSPICGEITTSESESTGITVPHTTLLSENRHLDQENDPDEPK